MKATAQPAPLETGGDASGGDNLGGDGDSYSGHGVSTFRTTTSSVAASLPSALSSVDSNPSVGSSDPEPGSSVGESDGGGSGGSGGLSTGAKAGIGVGCGVVGLAIIAALVFFLVRRAGRRSGKLPQGYKDQQSNTAFVDDKEAHSAARQAVDDGQHSFRDDNHHHHQQVPLNGGVGIGAMDTPHSTNSDDAADSYRPYHDLPPPGGAGMRSQASGSRQDVSSLGGGSETQSNLPRNVAHLVEDGMTEDDIRRLEREERELDEDLERAGRR